MAKNIRAYVCTGCGIGECLSAQRIADLSERDLGVPAKVHPPLCVPEGVEFLRKDIQAEGPDQVVIVACSERVNWDVFSTDSLQVKRVERVNIREQVAWSKPPNEEETQALAEDYLRMGVVRAQKSEPPAPKVTAKERTLLVVGGGVSGITAALQAAEADSEVVLVEKEEALGGWMARFFQRYPTRSPYRELEPVGIEAMVRQVQENPRVKVMTSAEVEKLSGQPGDFQVVIRQGGESVPVAVGAVVLATGWKPYDPSHLEYLGYGKHSNVINSVAMEEMARQGTMVRPSDGKQVQSVAFVQRVGSRTKDPFSYGSSISDMVALKQAQYVRRLSPEAACYVIYEHMITPGQSEMFYLEVQQQERVYFTKGDVRQLSQDEAGDVMVEIENSLIGGDLRLKVDLVVLATGMVPATLGQETLHLEYKQGPDVPLTTYGFADSNYICFPYETRRTGIYAAGCVREPMDAGASAEDAAGAALKAIQSVELLTAGAAVHPRVGDLSLPHTRLQGCTQCGRCIEECPFGAIEVDERNYPLLNPSRCRRCGICMGACPVQVISFEDYSVDQLSSMVSAVTVPEEEEKLRLLAFVCENDAYPAFDMAGINRQLYDASLRIIPLRCLGSLNIVLVRDALSRGIDGILLMGCRSGDDYQCHFMQGSQLAEQRVANVQEVLVRQMLEPERVKSVEVEISDYYKIPSLVSEFAEEIKAIGPNPYKGF